MFLSFLGEPQGVLVVWEGWSCGFLRVYSGYW